MGKETDATIAITLEAAFHSFESLSRHHLPALDELIVNRPTGLGSAMEANRRLRVILNILIWIEQSVSQISRLLEEKKKELENGN